MSTKILKGLKLNLLEFIDNDRSFLDKPQGKFSNLTQEEIQVVQAFISILRDTNYLNVETQTYIFSKYIPVKEVNRLLNATSKTKIPLATTSSKIDYCRKKLERDFGTDFIDKFFSYNPDILAYRDKVNEVYYRYNKEPREYLYSNISLDLPKTQYKNETVTDEEFTEFLNKIKPYSLKRQQELVESLDQKCLAYYNYLASTPLLSEADEARLLEIKLYLSL